MFNTTIILLHGLGGLLGPQYAKLTLYPLKSYIEHHKYTNVHIITYPSDDLTIVQSIEYVSNEISKLADKEKEIIIIGQSMGGVIAFNMHSAGWKIRLSISIGSPLHGARLITQIEDSLRGNLREQDFSYLLQKIKGLGHIELQKKKRQLQPPHRYKTITMGWFNSNFDGCVYKDEAIIDPIHNAHLSWSDHRTIFINPRLWYVVHNIIHKELISV